MRFTLEPKLEACLIKENVSNHWLIASVSPSHQIVRVRHVAYSNAMMKQRRFLWLQDTLLKNGIKQEPKTTRVVNQANARYNNVTLNIKACESKDARDSRVGSENVLLLTRRGTLGPI